MKNKVEAAVKVLRALKADNCVVISAHVNPDGDAIGSCFSMALCLELMGITPKILFQNYPEKYNFLLGHEFIFNGDIEKLCPDLFISLDCASKIRLGLAEQVFDRAAITLNIDHHISNTFYATHNIVESEASSTSEICYSVINLSAVINKPIAEAIYSGILFDTGAFKHATTSSDTLSVVANLMTQNIPFNEIYKEIMCVRSINEVHMLKVALNNMVMTDNGKIAYTFVDAKELSEYDANVNDLEGVVEYLLNIRGVKVSVLFSERPKGAGEIKVSFRSVSANVNSIASNFGGGGHINAAGATLKGSKEEVIAKTLNKIRELL